MSSAWKCPGAVARSKHTDLMLFFCQQLKGAAEYVCYYDDPTIFDVQFVILTGFFFFFFFKSKFNLLSQRKSSIYK